MPVTTETKPNDNLGNFTSYKEKYSSMKVKLKDLLYENELFQDELRKLQRELLDIYRDKETLLERVMQIEDIDLSNSDSESQTSDNVISANQMKQQPLMTTTTTNAAAPAAPPPPSNHNLQQNYPMVVTNNSGNLINPSSSQQHHHHHQQQQQQLSQQMQLQQQVNPITTNTNITATSNAPSLVSTQLLISPKTECYSQSQISNNSYTFVDDTTDASNGISSNNVKATPSNNNKSTPNNPKAKPKAATQNRSRPAAKTTKNNGTTTTKSTTNGSSRSTATKNQKQQHNQKVSTVDQQLPMTLVGQIHVPVNGEQYKQFMNQQTNPVEQISAKGVDLNEQMNVSTVSGGGQPSNYIQDHSQQTQHQAVHQINLPHLQQQQQPATTMSLDGLHHIQQPQTIMTTQGNFNFSQNYTLTDSMSNTNNNEMDVGDITVNQSNNITKATPTTNAPTPNPTSKPKPKAATSRSRSRPAAKTTKNTATVATKSTTNGSSRSTAGKNQKQQQQQQQPQQQQQQIQVLNPDQQQPHQLPMTLVGQIHVPVNGEQYKFINQQTSSIVDQNSIKSVDLNDQVNASAGVQAPSYIQDQPMQAQQQQTHHVVTQINLPMQQQPQTTVATTLSLESFHHIQQPQTIMTTQGNFNFSQQNYTLAEPTNNSQYQTYTMIGSNASNHSESILSTPPPIQIMNHHQLSHHNQQQNQQHHHHQHNDDPMSPEDLMEQHLENRRMEQAALLMPDWESSGPSEIFGSDSAIKFMAED